MANQIEARKLFIGAVTPDLGTEALESVERIAEVEADDRGCAVI